VVSSFVSAVGAGAGAGSGGVSSCFTFFFALLFFLALGKIEAHAESIAHSR
jgi:hypothetical protein